MFRRRMASAKVLKEYFTEFTTVGTQTWVVPAGCISVDAFIVNGGKTGEDGAKSTDGYHGGKGGDGGAASYYDNAVNAGSSINVVVGAKDTSSSFNGITPSYNIAGGERGINEGSYSLPKAGNNGIYAFDGKYNTKYPYRYGASGGGGAVTTTQLYVEGGDKGGGGGAGYNSNATYYRDAIAGSFYGAGGGGGGYYKGGVIVGRAGYQGIVILHYYAN